MFWLTQTITSPFLKRKFVKIHRFAKKYIKRTFVILKAWGETFHSKDAMAILILKKSSETMIHILNIFNRFGNFKFRFSARK
jgi:hypothetical protein